MSDIHILTGSNGGTSWQVVMHFPVPDVTNAVAVNYRTALVNSGIGGSTNLTEGTGPGEIAAAEKTQVEAGELLEYRCRFNIEGNGVEVAVVQAMLRAHYTREQGRVIGDVQAQLKYFGHLESKE